MLLAIRRLILEPNKEILRDANLTALSLWTNAEKVKALEVVVCTAKATHSRESNNYMTTYVGEIQIGITGPGVRTLFLMDTLSTLYILILLSNINLPTLLQ
jgi:hypothetical protein